MDVIISVLNSHFFEIFFILFSTVEGWFAGGLTNKYAIDSLFKDWKIRNKIIKQSVFSKNQKKLAKALALCVEDQILTKETLIKALQQKEIGEQISNLLHHILKEEITTAFKQKTFGEIPHYDESSQRSREFLAYFADKYLLQLIEITFKNINISALLSTPQLKVIFDKGFDLLIEQINKDDLFHDKISQLLQSHRLDNFIDQKYFHKHIAQITHTIIKEIIENKPQFIQQYLKNLLQDSNLNAMVHEVLSQLAQKTVGELLERPSSNSDSFSSILTPLLKSPEFEAIFKDIIKDLLKFISTVDRSIYSIVPKEVINDLEPNIVKILMPIIPLIKDFITEKGTDISSILRESIDYVIDQKTAKGLLGGFQNYIREMFREIIIQSVSKKHKIVAQLQKFVEQQDTISEISAQISSVIVDYLKKNTLADIFHQIKKSQLLDEEALANSFYKTLTQNVEHTPLTWYQKFENIKLSLVLSPERISSLSKASTLYFSEVLFSAIIKNEEKITGFITKKIEDLCSMPLASFFSPTNDKKKGFLSFLQEKKQGLFSQCTKVWGVLKNQGVCSILRPFQKNIAQYAVGQYSHFTNHTLKTIPIKKASDVLSDNKNFINESTLTLQKNILPSNIDKLVSVSQIVEENILKLNKDELCSIMQEFMGKEMSPLCRLGNWLGAIMGLSLSVLLLQIPAFQTHSWVELLFPQGVFLLLLSIVIFGAIGVITNKLAIWGLFHPFKKTKMPFHSQGIILKNKEKSAHGLAQFIDDQLLKTKEINDHFSQQKEALSQKFFHYVRHNNYQSLTHIAIQNQHLIAHWCVKKTQVQLINNDLAQTIAMSVGDISFSSFLKSRNHSVALNLLTKYKSWLAEQLIEAKNSTQTLGDVTSINISFLRAPLTQQMNAPNIQRYLLSQQEAYTKFQEKPLSTLVSPKKEEALIQALSRYIADLIFSPQSIQAISSFLNKQLSQKVPKDSRIDTVFNGALVNFIEDNLQQLVHHVIGVINKKISDSQADIIVFIQQDLRRVKPLTATTINSDNLVENVIQQAIPKMQDFFKRNQEDIGVVIHNIMKTVVYPTKIQELQASTQHLHLEELIADLLSNPTHKQIVEQHLSSITRHSMELILKKDICFITDLLGISQIAQACQKFPQEYNCMLSYLCALPHQEDLYQQSQDFVQAVLTPLELRVIFANLQQKDLSHFVSWGVDAFVNSPELNMIFQHLEQSIFTVLYTQKINDYIDIENFHQCLHVLIQEINTGKNLEEAYSFIITQLIEELSSQTVEGFVSKESIDYIAQTLLSSIMNGIEHNISDMIQTIKIKELSIDSFLQLEGKDIKLLFYRFAEDSLNSLVWFGSMGFLFGICKPASIALITLDKIASRKSA